MVGTKSQGLFHGAELAAKVGETPARLTSKWQVLVKLTQHYFHAH